MYDELIKRLRNCISDTVEDCAGCPYQGGYKGTYCMNGLISEAADAIEELSVVVRAQKAVLDKFPRWIPVTERLPDLYEDVQILFPNNQAAGFYDGCGWCTYTGDTWYSIVGEEEVKPTHWAKKLPEPPKEEE